jgi:adenine phosphoribosyltransferase
VPVVSSAGTGAGADIVEILRSRIRDIKDYPQPGIVFKDITPLLADGPAFAAVIAEIRSG